MSSRRQSRIRWARVVAIAIWLVVAASGIAMAITGITLQNAFIFSWLVLIGVTCLILTNGGE